MLLCCCSEAPPPSPRRLLLAVVVLGDLDTDTPPRAAFGEKKMGKGRRSARGICLKIPRPSTAEAAGLRFVWRGGTRFGACPRRGIIDNEKTHLYSLPAPNCAIPRKGKDEKQEKVQLHLEEVRPPPRASDSDDAATLPKKTRRCTTAPKVMFG